MTNSKQPTSQGKPLEVVPKSNKEYVIMHHRYWSNDSASYHEYWSLLKWSKHWLSRKWLYRAVKEYSYDYKSPVIYYNIKQAKAASNHYNCFIEESKNNER